MSWSSIGSLGTSSVKAYNTPLTWSPNGSVDVGRVVVLWVATDSVWNSGAPHGDTDQRWACHDDAGNVWITLGVQTDGKSFFESGAAACIFVSKLRRALTTSSVVTITNQAEANVRARAASGWEFSIAAGHSLGVPENSPQRAVANVSDPPSVAISGLPSREYLLIHCLGSEGPNTDAFTWYSDYTQIDGDGTTGDVAETNISVRGGFRIATLTGDTVDVTSDTADRDTSQVLAALCEVAELPFPNTPLIDNFDRADEYPLDAGIWDVDNTCGPSSPGSPRFLGISGTQAYGGTTGAGGQYLLDLYEGCCEVYATIDVPGYCGIVWHVTGTTEIAVGAGRALHWLPIDPGDSLYENLVGTQLGNQGGSSNEKFRAWRTPTAGDKLGAQHTHGLVAETRYDRTYVDLGDGWEPLMAVQLDSGGSPFTDFVGHIGLAIWDAVCRMDDFGGGQVNCAFASWYPQYIRRIRGGSFER